METPENKVECATLLLPANKSEAQPASPMLHRATTSTTIPPVIQDILVVILFEWMRLTEITAMNLATIFIASFLLSVTIRDRYSDHILLDHKNISRLHTLWVQLTSVQRLLQRPSENLYICQHYFFELGHYIASILLKVDISNVQNVFYILEIICTALDNHILQLGSRIRQTPWLNDWYFPASRSDRSDR